MKKRNNKGFTLIELLIVVAIIGIIVAIAIPNLLNAIQRAKQKRTMGDMRTAGTAAEAYAVDFNHYPAAAGYRFPGRSPDLPTATFGDPGAAASFQRSGHADLHPRFCPLRTAGIRTSFTTPAPPPTTRTTSSIRTAKTVQPRGQPWAKRRTSTTTSSSSTASSLQYPAGAQN